MFKKLLSSLRSARRPTNRPTDAGDHIENLARHAEVNLIPIGALSPLLHAPIWFDFAADYPTPATYDGVFWEVEPTAEYLFYLAGDFAKNDKGLLRFRTAPMEIRAERSFESDTINVCEHDGLREQQQAQITAADLSDIQDLTLAQVVAALLPHAQALGHERWCIPNKTPHLDIQSGIARLAFGKHFMTGKPYIEIIDEQLYLTRSHSPHASIFRTTTWADQPDLVVRDVLAAHDSVAGKYRDMPYVKLNGAIRL